MNGKSTIALPILVVSGWVAVAQPNPPKKPDEPFRVLVSTATEDASVSKEVLKASRELEKRIDKRDPWLEATRTPSEADIVVDVLSHSVEERFISRLDGTGAHFQNFVAEEHTIDARVTVLGDVELMRGVDKRKSGGKMSQAADDLAKALEDLCKERYWELAGRRRGASPGVV